MCEYQSVRSSFRRVFFGVPQGSVISPILFNFFVRDFPECAELTSSYADDFSIAESGVDLAEIEVKLNDDLRAISAWARRKRLSLSPDKSTVTLFTTDSHQYQYHPQVFLDGALIPLEKNPKILGLTFDPQMTFGPEASNVVDKLGTRLKIIKCLAGSDWGHSKEDLSLTYKAIGVSVISQNAALYSSNLKDSHHKKIQRMHNQNLRAITGAHSNASAEFLSRETKILPVKNHNNLVARQFLAKASVESHVSNRVVSAPPGPRNLRHTLATKFGADIEPFKRNGAIPRDTIRNVLDDLHTSAVAVAIDEMDSNPNRVLGARPPDVNTESEKALPREWRTTLCRLRSGFCKRLKSYEKLLGNTADDRCPECATESHTTEHLFECPAAPSPYYKIDLWTNPQHAAKFLSRLSSFNDLPPVSTPSDDLAPRPILVPLPRPPPRPPRAPPPPPPPSPPPLLALSLDDEVFDLFSNSSSSLSLNSADRDIFSILNYSSSSSSLNSADRDILSLLDVSSSSQ